MSIPSIFIVGPTASGKTHRAVTLAGRLGCDIISADSRQVYRGMNIGTGKDLEEYGQIPVHLIDIVPAGYKYNLYEYLRDYYDVKEHLDAESRKAIVCGGTGLYVESIIKGIRLPDVPADPALRASLQGKSLEQLTTILSSLKTLHNTTDVDTAQRAIRAIEIAVYYRNNPEAALAAKPSPMTDALVIGIDIPRALRRQRISQRLRARLDSGMVEEVQALLDSGIAPDDLIYYGLEYKFITFYITGRMDYNRMVDELETAIHQFAKRQMTWFRGMERRGITINWLDWQLDDDSFCATVKNHICKCAD